MALTYHTKALPLGLQMREWVLEEVLGAGGFAIVYRGRGVYFDEAVAIKEYFPAGITDRRVDGMTVSPTESGSEETYKYGLTKFLSEARILWNLSRPDRHPNIVCVRNLFEANGTAYMVMEFEDGEPLSRVLRNRPTLDAATVNSIFRPLMDGLERVHAAGVFHRDIKPGNILIDKGGRPVLIDFGSAKIRTTDAATTRFSFYTPSYAALEQYVDSMPQGPWTDIYALAATLYQCITGEKPADALVRAHTAAGLPLAERGLEGFDPQLLAAVDAGLTVQPAERPQTIASWLEMFPPAFRDRSPAVPQISSLDSDAARLPELDRTRVQTRSRAVELEAPEASGPEVAGPEAVVPEAVVPEPAAPEPTDPEPVAPEPAAPEPAAPEPAAPEPADPEPVPQPVEPKPRPVRPDHWKQLQALAARLRWRPPAMGPVLQAHGGKALQRLKTDRRVQLGVAGSVAAGALAAAVMMRPPAAAPVQADPPAAQVQSIAAQLAREASNSIAAWEGQLGAAADEPDIRAAIGQAEGLRDSLARAEDDAAARRLFAAFTDSAAVIDQMIAARMPPAPEPSLPAETEAGGADDLATARAELAGVLRSSQRTTRALIREVEAISGRRDFSVRQQEVARQQADRAREALAALQAVGQPAELGDRAALDGALAQARGPARQITLAMRAVRAISRNPEFAAAASVIDTTAAQAALAEASAQVRRIEGDINERAQGFAGGGTYASRARRLSQQFDRLASQTPPPGDAAWITVAAQARDIRRQMEQVLADVRASASAAQTADQSAGKAGSPAEARRIRTAAERELASLRRRYVSQTEAVARLYKRLDETTGKDPAVGEINSQLTAIFDRINRLISLQQQLDATSDGPKLRTLSAQAETLRAETGTQLTRVSATVRDFERKLRR